ncbi:MAG TPA: flagellar hook protein FlgE [Polyangia bacterium]|nr:flagellar hook protein FlgE [Polyangia bacterium]
MSLVTALYTGATGLQSNSQELSVVGDNIANSNTIGFKASRAAFADAMADNLLGGGAGQRGLGVKLEAIQKIVSQGALTNTGLATDLAIQGNGMFVVKGSAGGQTGTYYTRAGQFTVNKDGLLVNLDGMKVQGYTADSQGNVRASAVGDLKVGNSTAAPRASTAITIKANLQNDAPVQTAAFDPLNASGTSNFATSVTVYDSIGAAHQVDVYFCKTATGWDYHALTDGGSLTGGTAGTPVEIASASGVTFDGQGRLTAAPAATGTFNPIGATNPQPLTFNLGTPAPGGSGVDGLTSFASPSAVSFLSQDGFSSGELARISIDAKGQVVGGFTNGDTRVLGQVAMATFGAPDQLMRVGGTLFQAMPSSGPANVGAPSTADRGSIVAGALEQSNVDLASEFIRMIAAQRGFQANSKTLTTADSLLNELVQLKR